MEVEKQPIVHAQQTCATASPQPRFESGEKGGKIVHEENAENSPEERQAGTSEGRRPTGTLFFL